MKLLRLVDITCRPVRARRLLVGIRRLLWSFAIRFWLTIRSRLAVRSRLTIRSRLTVRTLSLLLIVRVGGLSRGRLRIGWLAVRLLRVRLTVRRRLAIRGILPVWLRSIRCLGTSGDDHDAASLAAGGD